MFLLQTPLITVPVSGVLFTRLARQPEELGLPSTDPNAIDCFMSCPSYEYFQLLPSLLAFAAPGLANLLPFLWMRSVDRRTRVAGMIAGILGLARSSVPVLVLFVGFGRLTSPQTGATYFKVDTGFGINSALAYIWLFGALAWFACAVALLVFGHVTRRRDTMVSPSDPDC